MKLEKSDHVLIIVKNCLMDKNNNLFLATAVSALSKLICLPFYIQDHFARSK